jgi:hypothetical protein
MEAQKPASFPVVSTSSMLEHKTTSSRTDARRQAPVSTPRATASATDSYPFRDELAYINQAWDSLSPAIRDAVMALVRSQSKC